MVRHSTPRIAVSFSAFLLIIAIVWAQGQNLFFRPTPLPDLEGPVLSADLVFLRGSAAPADATVLRSSK